METRNVAFYGVDHNQRPVFKAVDSAHFYGCLDKLAPSGKTAAADRKFVNGIQPEDLVFFGNEFNCEPMGTRPNVELRIVNNVVPEQQPQAPKYVLELTSEQTKLVERALDTYSRILAGELDEVAVVLRHNHNFEKNSKHPVPWENLLVLEDRLRELKQLLGLERSGNHGIFSHEISDNARKAYDVLKAVAYCRYTNEAKDEQQRRWTHWCDEPAKTSFDKDFELPVVKVKNEN